MTLLRAIVARMLEPSSWISIPPRIHTVSTVGSLEAKNGERFNIVIGLDEKLVAELKEKSLDEADEDLQRNTSDRKRFGEGPYDVWYQKDRTPFALLDEAGNLAALVWIGPASLPLGITRPIAQGFIWDTIGFRSYVPHRGKGLMTQFSATVIDFYMKNRPKRILWLETNSDNELGKRLYGKLGFVEQGRRADSGRIVMTREVS